MSFVLRPVTDRVLKMREKYRTTKPKVCIERLKIVTEFDQQHPELTGILKRALAFKNICEKTPVLISPDEVVVGSMASTYRGSCLFPEGDLTWIKKDYDAGLLTVPLTLISLTRKIWSIFSLWYPIGRITLCPPRWISTSPMAT